MKKNHKKAMVILSGGLDSTTLLYQVIKEFGEKNVTALTFNYGSNHNKKEIPMSVKTCLKLKVKQEVIEIASLFKYFNSSLLEGADAIPEGHYEQDNMKSTVVPFRNGILLAIATAFAEDRGIDKIYYGAHGGDHAIYPDCTDRFREAISQAAKEGTYNKVRILAPYNETDKVGILKTGIKLKVDYALTWTCYRGEEQPCGKCGSCIERTESFIKNNLVDPLYDDVGWKKAVKYYEEVNN